MMALVTVTLDPGSILLWLLIGLIAGFLASKVMTGRGKGLVADIVIGGIGALTGGFLARYLGITASVTSHSLFAANRGAPTGGCPRVWKLSMKLHSPGGGQGRAIVHVALGDGSLSYPVELTTWPYASHVPSTGVRARAEAAVKGLPP